MSQFYQKYHHLFEGDSNFMFPPRNKKFSNEYGYGGFAGKKLPGSVKTVKAKPQSIQSYPELPKRVMPAKPVKPINFNPNPKSRDPLKWNFSRGLAGNNSFTKQPEPVFGQRPKNQITSLGDYEPKRIFRSHRALSEVEGQNAYKTPFATHGKLTPTHPLTHSNLEISFLWLILTLSV